MNRLTPTVKLPSDGTFRMYSDEEREELKRIGNVSEKEIYRRLQAYEDTGLEPYEVERLAERADPISPGGDDRIDELEEAIDNLRFRLDAYENTGLSPKELAALIADNENLHRLVDAAQKILWSDTEEE